MKRLAMVLAYQGTAYRGWQKQVFFPQYSIQEVVETALSRFADHPIQVQCAGRTDKGVHASRQVIHFDTKAIRELFQWVRGVNFFLPRDIRILSVHEVDDQFNARFSALGRVYHYVIYNSPKESPFLRHITTWQRQSLNSQVMQEAGAVLLGEHDFSAFRGRDCQAHSPIRTMYQFSVETTPAMKSFLPQEGQLITLKFHANAFLHHMVRNIVGCLLDIGLSKKPPEWLKEVLQSKDRRAAGVMAPPNGLYLEQVIYPDVY